MLISYLKSVENPNRIGYNTKTQLWLPHASPEGGTATIGYGIKLPANGCVTIDGATVDATKGLTDAQVTSLLETNAENAVTSAKLIVDSTHGSGTFDQLSDLQKTLIADKVYQLGPSGAKKFPKFINAVRAKDYATAKQEGKTFYTANGKKLETRARTEAMKKLIDDNGDCASAPLAIAAQSQGSTMDIQPGDTLSGIAKATGTTVQELQKLNGIADPDKIRAYDKIKLPATAKAPTIQPLPVSTPSTAFQQYTVQPNDTLSGIAASNGMELRALRDANPQISNPNVIKVGQKINIPQTSGPTKEHAVTSKTDGSASSVRSDVLHSAGATAVSELLRCASEGRLPDKACAGNVAKAAALTAVTKAVPGVGVAVAVGSTIHSVGKDIHKGNYQQACARTFVTAHQTVVTTAMTTTAAEVAAGAAAAVGICNPVGLFLITCGAVGTTVFGLGKFYSPFHQSLGK